jgi:phosphopantothenoylcysteine decarboxylase/phosphopantothenate--cysteine ligase
MAAGLAGDPISATCLATSAPVVVAPAMDGEMYAHPATRANVARLRDAFGYAIVEPESGPLASGQIGVGRLAELPRIVEAVVAAIGARPIRAADPAARPPRLEASPRDADLATRHLIVTAGGTAEPIDPVRFILAVDRQDGRRDRRGGPRSGRRSPHRRLGQRSAAARGDVVGSARPPSRAALLERLTAPDGGAGFDALVMAAAVADFRPTDPSATKLSRGGPLRLELEPTPDILAEVVRIARGLDAAGALTRAPLEPPPVLVGFAAETGSLDGATDKLRRKGVDLLVANDVAEPGSGFGTDTNRVTILASDAPPDAWPLLSKREVADRLLDRIVARLADRGR